MLDTDSNNNTWVCAKMSSWKCVESTHLQIGISVCMSFEGTIVRHACACRKNTLLF